jgi:thioredoxin reductase (NADPH)
MTTLQSVDNAPADFAVERQAQMFPRLTEAQLGRVSRLGKQRPAKAGEVLFNQGDEDVHFYVLLSGEMEIVFRRLGQPDVRVTHGPGGFTGEVSLLTGRRALVTARMHTDGEVVDIPPAELRHLIVTDAELSELLMRAFILRRVGLINFHMGDAVLVGSRNNAGTLRLMEFLTRNAHPYSYLDVDQDTDAQSLLDQFQVRVEDVPFLICRGTKILKSPTNAEVADCLGFNVAIDTSEVRDVVVVGAGPAGLSAAVYAASEGLNVLVLEANAPGGQAGSSSKIENYLGFPTGISGQALAGRAFSQAEKFGADVAIARVAEQLDCSGIPFVIRMSNGERVRTRAVVIASGAQYRRLAVPDLERFENAGVYYGATFVEAAVCKGQEVVVIGGANSAGQAAVYLSGIAEKVYMLVRSGGLSETMSRYLIRRIEETPNIELQTWTEVAGLEGERTLERVRWRNVQTDEVEECPVRYLFCMTGADPNTRWLAGCVTLDEKGFVKTGQDLSAAELAAAGWPLARHPMLLETSRPGIFAVGDVRSGNVKRVASAVGEGGISVQLVHRVLGNA